MYLSYFASNQQQQERPTILARRVGKDDMAPDQDQDQDLGLVGLAISGGGIRSATFGLGVLEKLKQIGLLERIDYLSTVSGGGYIGAWLSVNCLRRQQLQAAQAEIAAKGAAETVAAAEAPDAKPAHRQEPDPPPAAPTDSADWLHPAADWRQSIAHLRRYSNYLAPKVGLLSADTWTMGTIWLRNALLMQIMIVLIIAILLLMPRLLHHVFTAWPASGNLRWITVLLFSAAAGGIARNQGQLGNAELRVVGRHGYLAGTVAVVAAGALIHHYVGAELFADNGNGPYIVPVALLVLLAGYLFMPAVESASGFLRRLWKGPTKKTPLREPGYGQAAVQCYVVLPMVLVGFLLGAVLWGLASGSHGNGKLAKIDSFGQMWIEGSSYWELSLVLAFGALGLFACRSSNRSGLLRRLLIPLTATFMSSLVLHTLITLIMWSLQGMQGNSASWRAMVWAPPAILFSFGLAVVMLIGIQGTSTRESVREWWSRMGAWLCIYGMAWMAIMIFAVYGPLAAAYLLDSGTWASHSALVTWALTTLGGILAGKSGATGATRSGEQVARTPTQSLFNLLALLAPILLIAGLFIAIATGIDLILANLNPANDEWIKFGISAAGHWRFLDQQTTCWNSLMLMAGALVLLAVMVRRVDINEFSLNAFYRNRLARCYLGATRVDQARHPQRFTGFDAEDDLPLAELNLHPLDSPPAGPFHIFNCALNLGGSADLSLHTRHSANFTLTPSYVGSCYTSKPERARSDTGQCETRDYGGVAQQVTVAKAMAVSGAAASPNQGFHTSPLMAFALTLFNVRLGWWFPNPKRQNQERPTPPLRYRLHSMLGLTDPNSLKFGIKYLVCEMFGVANAKSDFLMLSDGGHFENLAAYELVARRCRVIIISDAECDLAMQFEGLGSLIRMCRVDHNTEIDINLKPLGDGKQTYAIGTIIYPEPARAPGILIYLKASMTGDERSDILQYKATHPSFPHESTGNQFYGEDQFESYRGLGFETAGHAFGKVLFKPGQKVATAAYLAGLCQPTPR